MEAVEALLQRAPLPLLAAWAAAAAAVVLLLRLAFAPRRCYLVDFAVYRPPDSWRISKAAYGAIMEATGQFGPDQLAFMAKVLARSGLGDATYAPPSLTRVPMDLSMAARRAEFEAAAFGAVEELLKKAGVGAGDIGAVITNSSLFNTTPSLSAAVMNRFKMRENTINYHLGGMGCSAGVVAADLARQLLASNPRLRVLVVSTENLTHNWYPGADRGMLVTNTIFRVGGAALLFSGRAADGRRAKYELARVVRTNLACDDAAFRAVYESEDGEGVRGIRLDKSLMRVAGSALKRNLTELGPLVLPLGEQARYAAALGARRVWGPKAVPAYVPNFGAAFEHVCIHTGGRGVIDEIEAQLRLPPAAVEPSRASLFRFGNVSSSSVWYVLAYIESHRGLRRGDRVWQLAFGSGFKCNSAVLVARRRIRDAHPAWEGFDAAEMYKELAAMG